MQGLSIVSDYQFITERGVIVPDTAESRERVIELFRAAFGNDIDTDPSTPSGLLITMFTEQRDAVARNNAALANQINPEQATGVFLDGLFGFTGGDRKPATRSIINGVTLTGDAGTVVPVVSKLPVRQWTNEHARGHSFAFSKLPVRQWTVTTT